jgi:hypothetical protein
VLDCRLEPRVPFSAATFESVLSRRSRLYSGVQRPPPNILRTSHAAAESSSLAQSERDAKLRSHKGDSAAVSGRFNCETGVQVNCPRPRWSYWMTRVRRMARRTDPRRCSWFASVDDAKVVLWLEPGIANVLVQYTDCVNRYLEGIDYYGPEAPAQLRCGGGGAPLHESRRRRLREKLVGSFAVRALAPAPCQSRFFLRFQYRKSIKSP